MQIRVVKIRWYILKILLKKEMWRHLSNRGGLVLAILLVAAAMIISIFDVGKEKSTELLGGIHHCFIHGDTNDPWFQYLENHVPNMLKNRLRFRQLPQNLAPDQFIEYPPGTAAIEIRSPRETRTSKTSYQITLIHPVGDRAKMMLYENWFWRESYAFQLIRANQLLEKAGLGKLESPNFTQNESENAWLIQEAFANLENRILKLDPLHSNTKNGLTAGLPSIPEYQIEEQSRRESNLDTNAAITTALIIFSLFFTCVYLMPSLTCEERERGLLLAQALSPATSLEILIAKFLFYPLFGIVLALILVGLQQPIVLTKPIFWIGLIVLAAGSLGIGMTLASLAKTQRSASLGALIYMLIIALFLLICQQLNLPLLSSFVLEYHAPNLMYGILTNQMKPLHWTHLGLVSALSMLWIVIASMIFRRWGWQ